MGKDERIETLNQCHINLIYVAHSEIRRVVSYDKP